MLPNRNDEKIIPKRNTTTLTQYTSMLAFVCGLSKCEMCEYVVLSAMPINMSTILWMHWMYIFGSYKSVQKKVIFMEESKHRQVG